MSGKRPRVLIVDDIEDQRELLAELFARADCDTLAAAGTEQAEELLRSHRADFAVIDLMLSGDDDGWKAIERVRDIAPGTPVVISSVLDVFDYPSADAYLPKPFTGAEVQRVVDRFRAAR